MCTDIPKKLEVLPPLKPKSASDAPFEQTATDSATDKAQQNPIKIPTQSTEGLQPPKYGRRPYLIVQDKGAEENLRTPKALTHLANSTATLARQRMGIDNSQVVGDIKPIVLEASDNRIPWSRHY